MDQSEDDEYSEDEELRSLHRWQGEHRQYYRPPTDSLDRELQLWELDRLIQMGTLRYYVPINFLI